MVRKARKKFMFVAALLAALSALVFTACGGGGGGGGGITGGGVGGTGIAAGVITGFGSVIVNGVSYDTTAASISVDDNSSASQSDLQIGMKVLVRFDRSTSSADFIEYEPEVKGPVESVDVPAKLLVIMGQTVIVNSTTIFRNAAGLADFLVGDNAEASGFFDAAGNLRAAFLELEDPNLPQLKVKGTVFNLNPQAKTFDINGITIDYNAVPNPPSITEGSFVEAEGDSLVGDTLFADQLELEDFDFPDGEIEVEGIVTDETPAVGDFELNGVPVALTGQTLFEDGVPNDIVLNARLEVEGDLSGGVLLADKVQFRFEDDREFRFEGSVQSLNAAASTLNIFGLTVKVTASTILKDSREDLIPFTLGNIASGDFVEIGGFIDSSENLIAAKLERDTDPGPGEDRLRGPVTAAIPLSQVDILGVTGNVAGALEFEDINDQPITATEFFNTIELGDVVELEGDFSGGLFLANKAEIEALVP